MPFEIPIRRPRRYDLVDDRLGARLPRTIMRVDHFETDLVEPRWTEGERATLEVRGLVTLVAEQVDDLDGVCAPIKRRVAGQRATFYCSACQR